MDGISNFNTVWEWSPAGQEWVERVNKKAQYPLEVDSLMLAQLVGTVVNNGYVKTKKDSWLYVSLVDNLELESGVVPENFQTSRPMNNTGLVSHVLSDEWYHNKKYFALVHLIIQSLHISKVFLPIQKYYKSGVGEIKLALGIGLLCHITTCNVKWDGVFYMASRPSPEWLRIIKDNKISFTGDLVVPYGDSLCIQTSFPFTGKIHTVSASGGIDRVFSSIKEYNNREERIARLREKNKDKDAFKTLEERGYTTCLDSYGLRTKSGGYVVFITNKAEPIMRVGSVEYSTEHSIRVREISSGQLFTVYSGNFVNI